MTARQILEALLQYVHFGDRDHTAPRAARAYLSTRAPAEEEQQEALRAAARLVARLDAVHDSPSYRSVWILAQIHAGQYQGPSYDPELEAARSALGNIGALALPVEGRAPGASHEKKLGKKGGGANEHRED